MTGNAYLRYEKAKQNKHYALLVEKAIIRLADYGNFSKAEVLEDCDFDLFDENTFRWDYVKRAIEEQDAERDTELIPLALSFFKRRPSDPTIEPMSLAKKWIAHGHGKKTAGYCNVSEENGDLVIEQLIIKTGRANGMIKSREKTRRVGYRSGVSGLPPAGAKLLPLPRPRKA